jgi:hypothetical protein
MKQFLQLLFLLFYTTACQPVVELNDVQFTPKLVIWGNLHPDSIITVSISRSVPPLDKTTNRKVNQAIVLVYENNILLDTLKERDSSIYVSTKSLRPKEGNIYYVKVLKGGFDPIKTMPDTMPLRPQVIKVTAKELKKGDASAEFEILTNIPSHFKNYGISKLFSIKWQQQLNTSIENVPQDCDGFRFANFDFVKTNCFLFGGKIKISTNNFSFLELNNTKVKVSIASITNKGIDFFEKLNALNEQYTDYYSSTNIFWNPVYLPSFVDGGYGYVGCINTYNIEVQF